MDNKAFTLVELIVVITILAVLATVAFISFQGYGLSSRDAVRVSDIKSIEKVLSIYHVTNNKYPDPEDSEDITYSGSIVWKQGVFGNTGNTSRSSLSNIPVDPTTGFQYAYSITNTRQEYQIAAVLEGDISYHSISPSVYAGDQIARVYIRGNYNGKLIKVSSNSTTYILGVPSIITSDTTSLDIIDIINNNKLAYHGFNNLPASFEGSQYNVNGGFDFTPNRLVLFEGEISELENNTASRLDLLQKIQENYTGTNISSTEAISQLLLVDVSSELFANNYSSILLNSTIGTEIEVENISENFISNSTPCVFGSSVFGTCGL